ncbi:unnamed protein product, partial [Heterosigma akashiwo]
MDGGAQGGEFSRIRHFSDAHGIKVLPTARGNPDGNALAEISIGKICYKMRATLHVSSLPHSYWSEALHHAVETTNRIPTQGLENCVSPYEKWYGHLPSVRHLRAFGSPCFVYEPVELRPGKLSPRGLAHKFLSYGSSTGVYRLLSPNNTVIMSKHVVFNEKDVVTHSSTASSPLQVGSSSGVTTQPDSAPSSSSSRNRPSTPTRSDGATVPSSTSSRGRHFSSRGCRSAPGSVKTVTFADPLETAIPSSPSPTSPPPSTRNLCPSSSTNDVPAGGRKKRRKARTGGFLNSRQRRSLRRRGFGHQPNSPVTRSSLRNLSTSFAFLGTHRGPASNPWDPTQARRLPDGESYQQAMLKEMGSMESHDVKELVGLPEGANVISTRWVLSKKFDVDGNLVKYKARLVAQGFTQRESVNFTATYSPVIAAPSLRLMLFIAANKGHAVESLDISTAFLLNGDIDGDVYVKQPPGFVDKDHSNKVWKLRKALYGLRQSPRIWYLTLHDFLIQQNFVRSDYESCLYTRRNPVTGEDSMVTVYVDDLVLSSNLPSVITGLKASFASKFQITDLGPLNQILGIKVTRDLRNKCFFLSQASFIKDAISKFGLDYLPAVCTPMDHTANLAPTPGFKSSLPDDSNRYRSLVGTLAWTRPELAFTVHKLQRYQSNPEPKHFEAAQRAFRYLKGTQSEQQLRLGGDLVLRAYTDADFCQDRIKGKSATGYVIMLGDSPIVWASRLQTAVSTSTVEAELLALRSGLKDIMWLRHLLVDLGCPQAEPTPVVEDNSACIEWARDMVVSRKNRHFHVSYHLAKEQVNLGTIIRMHYAKTSDQLADIFTKALNAEVFE